MQKIVIKAPAKINLFLEILGKRHDGYHNLDTLFAKVNVFDILTITPLKTKKNITLKTANNTPCKLPPPKDNIIMKAVDKFKNEFGLNCGLNISLEKNIPAGAGLGGGSSDAAAILTALCELTLKDSNPITNKKLARLALGLGADVPFFLYKDTFCTAKGIGEDILPLHTKIQPVYITIVFPGICSPTKSVYERVNIPILTKLKTLDKLKSALKGGHPLNKWKKFLFNRLETAVFPFGKEIYTLSEELKALGSDAALMSGSGSSVYALNEDRKQAKYIAEKVKKKGRIIINTCFLGRNCADDGNKRDTHSPNE